MNGPIRRPAWLAGGEDPARCCFVRDGWSMPPALMDHTTCPGLGHLLLNVHKTPFWAMSRKESLAWYSSWPLPFLLSSILASAFVSERVCFCTFSVYLLYTHMEIPKHRDKIFQSIPVWMSISLTPIQYTGYIHGSEGLNMTMVQASCNPAKQRKNLRIPKRICEFNM